MGWMQDHVCNKVMCDFVTDGKRKISYNGA